MQNTQNFQGFKTDALNKGERILKKTRTEVSFDPSNMEHMEAVRLLFYNDQPKKPPVLLDEVAQSLYAAAMARYNVDNEKKRALNFLFKLEAPYTDIRSMVIAKIVEKSMEAHRRRYAARPTVVSSRSAERMERRTKAG